MVFSEYADFHPGGMAGLAAHAGRDATDVFRREHANHADILQKMQGLIVGRLVASRPHAAAVGRDEIQIYDDIYSISGESLQFHPAPFEQEPI